MALTCRLCSPREIVPLYRIGIWRCAEKPHQADESVLIVDLELCHDHLTTIKEAITSLVPPETVKEK